MLYFAHLVIIASVFNFFGAGLYCISDSLIFLSGRTICISSICISQIYVNVVLNYWICRYIISFLKEHGKEVYTEVHAAYVDTMNKVTVLNHFKTFD